MNIDNVISKRVASIELSLIRKFSNLVKEVPGAISLTIGQPDFLTPDNIKAAGKAAIDEDQTIYTHNQGFEKLREQIALNLKNKYSLDYSIDEITVTCGAEEAIDTAIRTIIDYGDEVLIPSPGFVAYSACISLSGGIPVYIPTYASDSFKLKASTIEKYISNKTKAIILSFPCNPTGAILDEYDLKEICKVAIKNDIIVISDEIYSDLTYEKKHISPASFNDMKERTIVINGFSKSYSMTGWRLGYIAAQEKISKHIVKVHQYNVTCASSISQIAGIEALKNGASFIAYMLNEYEKRRNYCYDRLKNMGLNCTKPEGAFYIFPDISKFSLSSEDFCTKLLFKDKLAVVPGSAFGPYGEGYIRISYAYSMDTLKNGLDRLENFIKAHYINL